MLSIIYNANIYYNDITINIIASNLKNEIIMKLLFKIKYSLRNWSLIYNAIKGKVRQ